jgi:putative aldouronate transport system substrate-binding protein
VPTSPPAVPTSPPATAAPAPTPAVVSVPATTRTAANVPLFVPSKLARPDFPSSNPLVDDAYQTYPSNPTTALPAEPPGHGGDLNVLVALYRLPFTPLDQNPAWQEINKRLGTNVKFSSVGTSDYPPKFATAIAGNDLPDTIHLLNGIKGAPNVPQFLTAKCADLTPYLAGDAARAYPNLASFSTDSWRNTGMVNNRIFAVPLPRNLTGLAGLFKNANVYDREIGADYVPKSADDYKRVLLQLNQPDSSRWATAFSQGNALHAYYASLFGAPNNWRLDTSGKLVKDYESDEYRAAIGFVRDLVVAGVFNTDSIAKPAEFRPSFAAGKWVMGPEGMGTWDLWRQGRNLNPPVDFRMLPPFAADGARKPTVFAGPGYIAATALKQASPDRIKEILGVLNWMAAPFGSAESMLLEYGVPDEDYNLDEHGNPVQTKKGLADAFNTPWNYVAQHTPVLYDPSLPDYGRTLQQAEEVLAPYLVADPTLTVVSATDAARGTLLKSKVVDATNDIVLGRRALSEWDQVVKQWQSDGGEQIRREYLEQLAK